MGLSNGDPNHTGQTAAQAKPGEPEVGQNPPPTQVGMEGPEDHAEHDHDFVDFAETFLSSEPFVERAPEAQQPANQLTGILIHRHNPSSFKLHGDLCEALKL